MFDNDHDNNTFTKAHNSSTGQVLERDLDDDVSGVNVASFKI